MSATSIGLLDRLRGTDAAAWKRVVDVYEPLLRRWLRPFAVQASDADDLIQESLAALVREMADFRHDGRPGCFRRWLRTVLLNRLRGQWRKRRPTALGDDIDPAAADELARRIDEEHDRHVVARLLELIRPEFTAPTWRAFEGVAVDGRPAAEVAAECGLSVNAVYIARSRVLARLREESAGLVE